jgi:cytochrome c-type protein NapC
MNPEKQQPRAQQPHSKATERKQTCIDCHKGIAHQKPKGMKDEDEE